jgi:hypothetical protein
MRRSFKVATVFAGAAALAGGYGPTALAATTQATTAGITWGPCSTTGNSHWVHLYYPGGDHADECFGFTGHHATNATIASLCPGNNFGSIYSAATETAQNYAFSPGKAARAPMSYWTGHGGDYHVGSLSISFWSGNATCPA